MKLFAKKQCATRQWQGPAATTNCARPGGPAQPQQCCQHTHEANARAMLRYPLDGEHVSRNSGRLQTGHLRTHASVMEVVSLYEDDVAVLTLKRSSHRPLS